MILKDPKELLSYIPESERGKKKPITFYFHPFTVGKYFDYMKAVKPSISSTGDVDIVNTLDAQLAIFDNEVVKIENVVWPGSDKADAKVTITGKEKIKEFREFIHPPTIVLEIINHIQNSSNIDEDTEKK